MAAITCVFKTSLAYAGADDDADPVVARLSGTTAVASYSQPLVVGAIAQVNYIGVGAITNIVKLSLIEESLAFIPSDFSITIKVKIDYGNIFTYGNTSIQDLTVSYSKAQGAKYNSKAYFTFENAKYVKITVQAITPDPVISGGFDVRNILLLENELRPSSFVSGVLGIGFPQNLQTDNTKTTEDELAIKWNSWDGSVQGRGVTHTQLEWAWVEQGTESLYQINGVLNTELIFRGNSIRVDLPVKVTTYSIPKLFEGEGDIFYRIRGVNLSETIFGPWSSSIAYHLDEGHQQNINWQSTISFAEDGKRSAVVEYFDGSLRPRQTVTKDNVTGTTISAETFYDYQGRPAIQILPAPGITGINTVIKYQANLNLFNTQLPNSNPADIFDLKPINALEPLVGSSVNPGADYYYSDKNPERNIGNNQFIPDAGGYPYTQTQYTPDGTGRVMVQSGVGPQHKMGSGHETRYYYGTPSQEELDGLFGSEVGFRSHYFKNMVKDANGQISVSYVDMHGRTIATALAGKKPDNLQGLNTSDNSLYPNQSSENEVIVRDLLLYTNTNVKSDNSVESFNTILVSSAGTYDFAYGVNIDKLNMTSCTPGMQLCFDCLYDLEIAITDESGENEPLVWKFSNVSLNPDVDCNTTTPELVAISAPLGNPARFELGSIKISQFLDPGSYSIRKTLRISESSFQHYLELYRSSAMCESKEELIQTIYEQLKEETGCDNPPPSEEAALLAACQACKENLGVSEEAFRISYLASLGITNHEQTQLPQLEADIRTAYRTAYNNCELLCNTTSTRSLETIRLLMLEDMKPFSGQYAKAASPGGSMYNKYDIFSEQLAGQPFYKNPKTENSQPTSYLDPLGYPDQALYGGSVNLPTLTKQQFQDLFKDSWTDALLYYHPEFKKLKFAEDNLRVSYDWIDKFMSVSSYAEANSSPYNYVLSSGNTTSAPYNDPFYLLAPVIYRNEMLNKIQSSFLDLGGGQVASMWQVAYAQVKCKNYADPVQRKNCIMLVNPLPPYSLSSDDNDRLWQIFQGLYANERRKDINKYIAQNTPVVENNDLISEDYLVHFPETDQQIADQGYQTGGVQSSTEWDWWPPTVPPYGPPAGVSLDPSLINATNYSSQCESYIEHWKAALRPCIEAHISNVEQREIVLSEITAGMKTVCINGSDPANPYGSSNVSPTYSGGGPQSFEEVIEAVFDSHDIPINILCNPFVIEWPKAYGRGPRMFQELTTVVDQCACDNFSALSTQAIAAGYNPSDLSSINTFLQLQYQETLTAALHAALLNCSQYNQLVCEPTLVNRSCHDPNPCTEDCEIFTRSPIQPADCSEWKALISCFYEREGATVDGESDCEAQFVAYYNLSYNGILTWSQIATLYQNSCGQSLNICTTCTTPATCSTTVCQMKFVPFQLADPQPLPRFLKCGSTMAKSCFSCQELSELTAEFKNYFGSPEDAAPLFDNAGLTVNQLGSNVLFAKFLNYRTGFQYNWMTYAKKAADASPACNLQNYASNTNATQTVICREQVPLTDPTDITTAIGPCQSVYNQAVALADLIWEEKLQRLMKEFEKDYKAKCLYSEMSERFTVSYENKEYHYTLYYYDMAGNLVKTVPPAGVVPDYSPYFLQQVNWFRNIEMLKVPSHRLVTEYRYNSLNQVVAQNSPDANTSLFWYDRIGRLVVSQNAQQAAEVNKKYSYTRYDEFGRIIEVGQKTHSSPMTQSLSQGDPAQLENWILNSGGDREHVTYTGYDAPFGQSAQSPNGTFYGLGIDQENLRNRVSFTYTRDLENGVTEPPFHSGTFYTYDIQGNVKMLLQDYSGVADMQVTGNSQKRIVYDYDLISGKVNMVSYQPDWFSTALQQWIRPTDKFFHRYDYDAQNRLTDVYTSRDKIVWERDASYQYYKHGPLSRVEYGQLRTQGLDYAYTIQGWLKGVNSTAITASSAVCPEGTVLGSILNLTGRSQYSQPPVYSASQEINFETGFESLGGDVFETQIYPGGSVCTPDQGATTNVAYTNGDMGQDGDPASSLNNIVARDAFGFSLNYFNNDYKAINTGIQPFADGLHNLPLLNNDVMITGAQLFNGNIASMLVNIPRLGIAGNGIGGNNPILYGYRYDQLNRIVGMNAYKNNPANTLPNTFIPQGMEDYKERITYDPNGNILTYHRNGTSTSLREGEGAGGTGMDVLDYKYLYIKTDNTKGEFTPGEPVTDPLLDRYTNQLASVRDAIADDKYTIDIDNQAAFNYEYDKIGNLVKDKKEGILDISWTVYGKIKSIIKDADKSESTTNDQTIISYTYDARGNRITKTVTPPQGSGPAKTTIYVRDASRNVMSVYEREMAGAIKQTELHLYGSSRIGMATERSVAVTADPAFNASFGRGILNTFTRNEKIFELSNHLGNVLVTISDKKKPVDSDGDGDIDYFESDVVNANDFFPGGMDMPGRQYNATTGYRYGFSGKERDNKDGVVQYDYGFRIYDPRLVRFKSVDPLSKEYPWYTPYQYAGNKPIAFIDLDGAEESTPEMVEEAKQLITDFANDTKITGSAAWPKISKQTFIDQLWYQTIDKGYTIHQGSGWLCGVAATAHLFASRNPTKYVESMIQLYKEGYFYKQDGSNNKVKAKGYLRNLEVNEVGYDNNHGSGMKAIDFMFLATIRDNLNSPLLDFKGSYKEDIAGGTFPGEIRALLVSYFGFGKMTKNQAYTSETKSDYYDILRATSADKGVILFGNIGVSEPSKKGKHYVVLKSFHIIFDNNGIASFDLEYWDYGNKQLTKETLSKDDFDKRVKGIFITDK